MGYFENWFTWTIGYLQTSSMSWITTVVTPWSTWLLSRFPSLHHFSAAGSHDKIESKFADVYVPPSTWNVLDRVAPRDPGKRDQTEVASLFAVTNFFPEFFWTLKIALLCIYLNENTCFPLLGVGRAATSLQSLPLVWSKTSVLARCSS